MTRTAYLDAIRFGFPIRARGIPSDVTAEDYHVAPGENGELEARAGVVDSGNRYRSVSLQDLSCRGTVPERKCPPPDWNGKLSAETLLRMVKTGAPVTAGQRSYRRILGLYLKKDSCSRLIYSAACLDPNSSAVVYEPVRLLQG